MIIDRKYDILARTQFVFFCDLYADYTLWFSITSTCLSTKELPGDYGGNSPHDLVSWLDTELVPAGPAASTAFRFPRSTYRLVGTRY